MKILVCIFILFLYSCTTNGTVENAEESVTKTDIVNTSPFRIGSSKNEKALNLVKKGNALKNSGDQVALYLEAIALDSKYAVAFCNIGINKAIEGKDEEAITFYTKAIEAEPKYVDALYNRAISRSKLGDLDGAETDYEECIKINPLYKSAYNNLGVLKHNRGDYQGAIVEYKRVIDIDSLHISSWVNTGNAMFALGNKDEALKNYNRVIKIDPTLAVCYYNKGEVLYSAGKIRKAMKCWREGVKYAQMNTAVLDNLLQRLQKTIADIKRYKKIEEAHTKEIKRVPSNGDNYYKRAMCRVKLDKTKEAQVDFKKAYELGVTEAYKFIKREKS